MPWAPEPVITHTGSNQINLAVTMFWPNNDFGFVMMTNVGRRPTTPRKNRLPSSTVASPHQPSARIKN
jgi:hypothetical protein